MRKIILVFLIFLVACNPFGINRMNQMSTSIHDKIQEDLEQRLLSDQNIWLSNKEISLEIGRSSLEGMGIRNQRDYDLRFQIEITTLNCTAECVELIFDESEQTLGPLKTTSLPLLVKALQEGLPGESTFIVKVKDLDHNSTYESEVLTVITT